jgi:cytosine deaminase
MFLREYLVRAQGGSSSSFVLQNVHIPLAVLPKETTTTVNDERNSRIAEDGFLLCHVSIEDGKISTVHVVCDNPNGASLLDSSAVTIDCQRSILLPCFVDCHTHLDKTMTAGRNRNSTGTMEEAWLQKEPKDWQYWVSLENDLQRRMDFAVRCALHHGTRAMRTHLDGYDCGEDYEFGERLRTAVYDAFRTVQDNYKGQMELQAVANLYLPLYHTLPEVARAHCERAKRTPGTCLGAYIGNTAETPQDDAVMHFDAMLKFAHEFHLDVDLHIDESNDPRCCAMKPFVKSLEKARAAGYHGRVVLGHCCALSLQDDETKGYICQQLAKLGNVFCVANPFTNLSLQDRRGTRPPLGVEIPPGTPRTPQWRGLTLLQELRTAGVAVATASDNVRDFWLSAGSDYDMLAVWSITQALCHLDTDPNEGSWADIVTSIPANAMGLMGDNVDVAAPLSQNQPADLILFPGARSASEMFSRPHHDRIVLRKGVVQDSSLPDYAELDDLMEMKTSAERAKGETELIHQYLGIDVVEQTSLEIQSADYTLIPHFYQLESWDCGATCLWMLLKWVGCSDDFTSKDAYTPNMLSPQDMEGRRNILEILSTQSIWTSDLVWVLHTWEKSTKALSYILLSRNISSPEEQYKDFQYYHQDFASDEARVTRTFQELQGQHAPMIETEKLPFARIIGIVSKNKNVVAILLVDNNILLKKHKLADRTHDAATIDQVSNYAGHYVILCGTSSDPQHLKGAKDLLPTEFTTTPDTLERGYCCVLANPDPASYSPYMFVVPHHLEASWNTRGTDKDVIFVRRKFGACLKGSNIL